MEKIKEIIPGVIEKLSAGNTQSQQELLKLWKQSLGDKLAAHTRIVQMRDKKLIVNVDSPALLFHLNMKRQRIIEALRTAEPTLEAISLRIGRIK